MLKKMGFSEQWIQQRAQNLFSSKCNLFRGCKHLIEHITPLEWSLRHLHWVFHTAQACSCMICIDLRKQSFEVSNFFTSRNDEIYINFDEFISISKCLIQLKNCLLCLLEAIEYHSSLISLDRISEQRSRLDTASNSFSHPNWENKNWNIQVNYGPKVSQVDVLED